jgi:hypothetical protein
VLHKLLTEQQYEEFSIHATYVQFNNRERRQRCELAAISAIRKWYAASDARPFTFSTVTIELPQVNGVIPWDVEVTQYAMGYIAANAPMIKHVAVGVNATDKAHLGSYVQRAHDLFQAWVGPKDIKIRPVEHMTKREVYDSLPVDLAALAWCCRRPVYSADLSSARPCGGCRTCAEMRRFGIPMSPIHLV